MNPRRRAIVDLAGVIFFLLPVCAFIGMSSWDYMTSSWAMAEGSREAGGLPFPFVPLLKSLIPLTALLLGMQALADLLRDILILTGRGDYQRGPTVPPGEVL